MRDGKALAFDYADATAPIELAQRPAIEKVPRLDWAGRSAAEIAADLSHGVSFSRRGLHRM